MVYCRKCGSKLDKFCHNYMCNNCCKDYTNKQINKLMELHKTC